MTYSGVRPQCHFHRFGLCGDTSGLAWHQLLGLGTWTFLGHFTCPHTLQPLLVFIGDVHSCASIPRHIWRTTRGQPGLEVSPEASAPVCCTDHSSLERQQTWFPWVGCIQRPSLPRLGRAGRLRRLKGHGLSAGTTVGCRGTRWPSLRKGLVGFTTRNDFWN